MPPPSSTVALRAGLGMNDKARLILADGTIFRGRSFGAKGTRGGEFVFNTGMSGYQEILTDPSYRGQVVVMTYPSIGNYGICPEDGESERAWVEGMVVRDLSPIASNFRSRETLSDYLARQGVVGIEGVDTRALTRRLRTQGAMPGLVTTELSTVAELQEKVASIPDMGGRDLVSDLSRPAASQWIEGLQPPFGGEISASVSGGERPRVCVLDCGAKANIFRSLKSSGFEVWRLPPDSSSEAILAMEPKGVLLSNGPGDPRALVEIQETVRQLLGRVPIMGICLGHQLLAAAAGARLLKMKFGHHGCNHPVLDKESGLVQVTSQNHGFAVERQGLDELGAKVTHESLNDGSIEGLSFPELAAFSVQFHPEAAPGPRDASGLFLRFADLISGREGAPCQ